LPALRLHLAPPRGYAGALPSATAFGARPASFSPPECPLLANRLRQFPRYPLQCAAVWAFLCSPVYLPQPLSGDFQAPADAHIGARPACRTAPCAAFPPFLLADAR